jgi:hypothetical protein
MADIFPTERELEVLVTEGDDVRWWLIQANGSLVPEEDQEAIRPATANPCDGDWYMPWFNTKPHVHDDDHDYPWSVHARGTRVSVEMLHSLMLARCTA